MSLCKHPEEVCCSMTLYHGKVYCDNANGFCQLHDEPPPVTNADHIRSMTDEEMVEFLFEYGAYTVCDLVCGGKCYAIASLEKTASQKCREIILAKLREPYKEKEHEKLQRDGEGHAGRNAEIQERRAGSVCGALGRDC